LYTAFAVKQQLTTEILLGELSSTQPLSVTRSEDITAIREWAKTSRRPRRLISLYQSNIVVASARSTVRLLEGPLSEAALFLK